jgi:hypothetical protein
MEIRAYHSAHLQWLSSMRSGIAHFTALICIAIDFHLSRSHRTVAEILNT